MDWLHETNTFGRIKIYINKESKQVIVTTYDHEFTLSNTFLKKKKYF